MSYKKIYAVIVAAGSGKRMGTETPKQLLPYGASTVLEESVRKFAFRSDIDAIVVVAPGDGSLDKTYNQIMGDIRTAAAESAADKAADILIVKGGEERADSVLSGLRGAADDAKAKGVSAEDVMVLIHDAARPGVYKGIIDRCIEAMAECRAVTAAMPSTDSVRMISESPLNEEHSYPIITSADVPRDRVFCVQTPQVFRLSDIIHAHELARQDGFIGTDDASYAEHASIDVGIIKGAKANLKITTPEDINLSTRVGNGYDVHRLTEGRDLILCGVKIPYEKGLDGHSDADVAVHALMDAMLGAAGLGDIGRHFPDTDPKYKGADSMQLLAKVKEMRVDFGIGNVDITIIAQAPKLAPYIDEMSDNIANTLGVAQGAVNVKATTEEGLGFTGRGEGIAAFASCTIEGSF